MVAGILSGFRKDAGQPRPSYLQNHAAGPGMGFVPSFLRWRTAYGYRPALGNRPVQGTHFSQTGAGCGPGIYRHGGILAMVTRILNYAFSEPRSWLLQRLTALMLVGYLVMFTALVAVNKPVQFNVWKSMFRPGWMRVATLIFIFSLLLHAWQGIRNILRDYVKLPILRIVMERLVTGVLLVYAVWSIRILWSL